MFYISLIILLAHSLCTYITE